MKNLRNDYKAILILFVIIASYIVGFHMGERSVIYGQNIYEESQEQGTYFAEYKGEVHYYYYQGTE